MAQVATEGTNGITEASAWKDVTLLLLGTLADHPVHCGASDAEEYRKHLRESIQTLQGGGEASQILMNAGGVIQAVTHYAGQTQKQVDLLLTDAKDVTQLFLRHLEKLHTDAEAQPIVSGLRSTLEAALNEGKLGSARESAETSLEELAKHAGTVRAQALELTGNLRDRITILEQSAPQALKPSSTAAPTMDATTGLAKRADGEVALQRALESTVESGPKSYAAVFYLHRMALTNARFGEAIGNQVLLFCSQHLATTVTRATDSLYRWSGPAFVAVLERSESAAAVSSEIQRLMSSPFSRFFETPSRSVYLPVKVTADVIPLFETNFAEVADKIERFILQTSGQASSE